LIVEDLEINRTILKAVLSKMIPNAIFTEAENGEIGIQYFKQFDFDLIFMDIQMPILDGFETTEKIRELEKDKSEKSIILAFTASALLSQKEACLHAGMDDYFTKPIRIETMSQILEKYLS
jgi:CheY-like chemotaxis protein